MLFHPDFFHATPEKFCQLDGRPSLFKSVFNKAFEKLYHSLKNKEEIEKEDKATALCCVVLHNVCTIIIHHIPMCYMHMYATLPRKLR